MSIVSIKVDGNGSKGNARYMTAHLVGLLNAAGFSCNAGDTAIDVIVTGKASRAGAEPVNQLDAQILAELKAIRKAVEPKPIGIVMSVGKTTVAEWALPEQINKCSNLALLRKLAHMVRQDGDRLRADTMQLAHGLGYSGLYRNLPENVANLASALVVACKDGKNTAHLYDLAGQFLGATGGAYRA